jgi:glyoxylase-like metal-dependent hydrolase (beta-lactamase superfamily II)
LTGREAGIAVNSHPHIDHFHGNAVFGGGTVILASKLCNELLLKQEKRYPFREMAGEEELMKLKERVDKGSGIQLLNDKNEYLFSRCLAVKDYHLRMPNIVFDKSLLIQGKTRTVRLESAGNCHSEDDVILCLDDEKILFAGDTLFVKQHPWLGSGNPVNQKKFLLGELNSPYEKYIPGHGGLGTKQDLKDQSEYIGIIIDYVKNTDPNKKLTLEDLPEKFKNWDPLCFQWNLDSIKETIEE